MLPSHIAAAEYRKRTGKIFLQVQLFQTDGTGILFPFSRAGQRRIQGKLHSVCVCAQIYTRLNGQST